MSGINLVILDALSRNGNMVTSSQVQELGFSKQALSDYLKAGLLERVRQSAISIHDAVRDEIHTLIPGPENVVFSHESALLLHGVYDRASFAHATTVPGDKVCRAR